MAIGISGEHAELAASVRKWAQSQRSVDAVRSAEHDPGELARWVPKAAEMALTSIALPEADGGGGGTVLDQGVALEAAANELVPGPVLGTTLAGLVVEDGPLRSGIAAGAVCVGVGLRPGLRVDGARLTGVVDVVLDAPSATHLLLGASTEDAGRWFVVPAERVSVTPGTSPDLSHTVGSVSVPDLDLDGLLEVRTTTGALRRQSAVLAAAEASGISQWCLDTAVEYAKVREQFGRPIGGFQSIKHLCAQMLETAESVTAAAWDAASLAESDEEDAQRRFAACVAATICFDGAVEVAKSCIQVLGGIGFTFEHDAHLYLRRALALRSWVGGSHGWAGELAGLAATGVRRQPHVDFHGQDEEFRHDARAEAERVAGLPAPQRRSALAESGYLAPHWPRPYGLGADAVQQLVIDEELAAAGVQRPELAIGAWAAPTILGHGSADQQHRFVGPTLRGEIAWCQLFSEPGAGSDLASLRTRAERVSGGLDDRGPGWLLTGQKVWTSMAREADWGICLARTDPEARPHAGISYFLVDMSAEGIDVRPLREMTGEAMFNEVFLDDVFVPDACVVGEVNDGWKLARTTLANERVAMAGSGLGESLEPAVTLLGSAPDPPLGPGDVIAVGRAVAWASVVKLLGTRATMRSIAGQGPGAESSVAKLVGVRSRQDSAELLVELLGDRVLCGGEEDVRAAMHQLLLTRCLSIAGGTTQILRNVAGERILGLPRG